MDVGDEVLSVNSKAIENQSAATIKEYLESPENNMVTLFLAKKDMPSRRCRVVLKRGVSTLRKSADDVSVESGRRSSTSAGQFPLRMSMPDAGYRV
jgi:hypothetical protein